jgi:hypothetical protein
MDNASQGNCPSLSSCRQVIETLCAIVAVARKFAGKLHWMWIDGSEFEVGFGAKVTQRLKPKPAR